MLPTHVGVNGGLALLNRSSSCFVLFGFNMFNITFNNLFIISGQFLDVVANSLFMFWSAAKMKYHVPDI